MASSVNLFQAAVGPELRYYLTCEMCLNRHSFEHCVAKSHFDKVWATLQELPPDMPYDQARSLDIFKQTVLLRDHGIRFNHLDGSIEAFGGRIEPQAAFSPPIRELPGLEPTFGQPAPPSGPPPQTHDYGSSRPYQPPPPSAPPPFDSMGYGVPACSSSAVPPDPWMRSTGMPSSSSQLGGRENMAAPSASMSTFHRPAPSPPQVPSMDATDVWGMRSSALGSTSPPSMPAPLNGSTVHRAPPSPPQGPPPPDALDAWRQPPDPPWSFSCPTVRPVASTPPILVPPLTQEAARPSRCREHSPAHSTSPSEIAQVNHFKCGNGAADEESLWHRKWDLGTDHGMLENAIAELRVRAAAAQSQGVKITLDVRLVEDSAVPEASHASSEPEPAPSVFSPSPPATTSSEPELAPPNVWEAYSVGQERLQMPARIAPPICFSEASPSWEASGSAQPVTRGEAPLPHWVTSAARTATTPGASPAAPVWVAPPLPPSPAGPRQLWGNLAEVSAVTMSAAPASTYNGSSRGPLEADPAVSSEEASTGASSDLALHDEVDARFYGQWHVGKVHKFLSDNLIQVQWDEDGTISNLARDDIRPKDI